MRVQAIPSLAELAGFGAEALGMAHTLPEILQQPEMWEDTLERVRHHQRRVATLLDDAGLGHPQPPWIVLTGAGSSDFVGQLVAPAFRRRFACPVETLASPDLLTQTPSLLVRERRYLFVWFSRSGTTAEALELLELLERDFAASHHLFITCNELGVFARRPRANSTCLTLNDAVHDRGLAMTSSFTSMALAGLLLGTGLELADEVSALARAGRRLLDESSQILGRVAQRKDAFACFLGSGVHKAAAGEAALKVLELSAGAVKTRFDSFLGVRHGPLAGLDRGSLLVGFLSAEPEERRYELDVVEEVQRKGLAGLVLLVAPEFDARSKYLADEYVELEDGVPAPLCCLLYVVVGQLLGLFSSLVHGLKPDSPSPNGAIQRVVTHLRPPHEETRDQTP